MFCGRVDNMKDPFYSPHRHEYWEIVWCLKDEGHQYIDFTEYQNRANRFFTITPGQVHSSHCMGDDVRFLVFATGFIDTHPRNNQLINSVFSSFDRVPYIDCCDEGIVYLESIFSLLSEECKRPDCDWDLVESLVTSFMRYLIRYAKPSESSSKVYDRRVTRLVELIDKHYKQEIQSEFYAVQLSLTPKRLNELTKRDRGKSVTQLIHDRLVLEANRELTFSKKSIKKIALNLGFVDPAYFSRFYRCQTGETPTNFRLKCSNNARK